MQLLTTPKLTANSKSRSWRKFAWLVQLGHYREKGKKYNGIPKVPKGEQIPTPSGGDGGVGHCRH